MVVFSANLLQEPAHDHHLASAYAIAVPFAFKGGYLVGSYFDLAA
jgi:hypothetical protein